MAATAASRHEDVKVVLIDTQYVETDPHSFKSVVQKLTGKDSCVAWIEESSVSGGIKTATKAAVKGRAAERPYAAVGGGYAGGGAMLSKGLSFKDLDRMIMEAPPVDEWRWLWTD